MEENRYLVHYGIKGQKWGVRRYQNYDGTYTKAGKMARRVRRVDRLENKRNKQEARYNKAKDVEMRYGERYLKAKGKRDRYTRKLNAAENGIRAKLYGANGRKIRKLNKKLSKAEDRYQRAANQYEAAKDFTLRQNIKLNRLDKQFTAKKQRIASLAVNDMAKVYDGEMTKQQFNAKWAGTGFKVS